MRIPDWLFNLGAEKRKDGAVLTVTVPVERVEKWWKRMFGKNKY